MESLGMWEDVLSIVDDETGNDKSRLFVQDDNWDGGQYLRYHLLSSLIFGLSSVVFCASLCTVLVVLYQNTAETQPLTSILSSSHAHNPRA